MPQSYTSLEASLHDDFWAAEGPPAELPLLRTFLQNAPGPSLEIGSGSGRLLLPLLQEGFPVDGLEPSAEMNELCRHSAARVGLPVTLHQGDMDNWIAPQHYHSLLIPAFTLQLSARPADTLQHLAAMLTPNGVLYLSTFTPRAELSEALPENEWYHDQEVTLANGSIATINTRHRIDREKQILHREHRYMLHSACDELLSKHESMQSVHWFHRDQLKDMLQSAGFVIEKQFADFKPSRHSLKNALVVTTWARRTSLVSD